MTISLNLPGDWRMHGICGEDPEMWFPGSNDQLGITAAKAACHNCPVIAECAKWALDTQQPYGVWGGMSEQDRAQELKRRQAPPRPRGRRDLKTHCAQGHEYTVANICLDHRGNRACVTCRKARNVRKLAAEKARRAEREAS